MNDNKLKNNNLLEDNISLYSRYSVSTLFLKFFVTLLLTNKITKSVSLKIIRFTLIKNNKFLIGFLNGVYFGGRNINEVRNNVRILSKNNIYSVLDYAIEGENDEIFFDNAVESTLKLIDLASEEKNIPYVVIKPSSLGSIHVYEKKAKDINFFGENINSWDRILKRYNKIFSYAELKSVRVMIDAEQSWIQTAVDKIAIDCMIKYNKSSPIITLTIQSYKKEAVDLLTMIHSIAINNNIKAGVKIVRGAYLEEETNNKEKSVGTFFSKKEDTDSNYHFLVKFISKEIDFFYPFFATHNEKSISTILNENELKNRSFWIGQLYGIRDDISSELAFNGIKTCKYLPYGPIDKSLPYLLRRINENAVATDTFVKENKNIRKEIISRLKHKLEWQ
ncbi:proline dehydrogenase family protein [Xenorhabdus japonica]|uniref:L-proline dehydrogenase n=1 Tax=Xenorhabdus japonica TaxID=53341 RepID=A0A1I5BL67_9GAMM|nr:proline dehydrogenase family protein [Xenorhabdus japonica]SFN75392.1 L-proline dehydrogenase [Xenorhabdus japonica]